MASDILIIDDEMDIRELVAGILQDEGYETRTARDSDTALNAIATRRPNLLFLDIWVDADGIGKFFAHPDVQAQGAQLFKSKDATVWMPAPSRICWTSSSSSGDFTR